MPNQSPKKMPNQSPKKKDAKPDANEDARPATKEDDSQMPEDDKPFELVYTSARWQGWNTYGVEIVNTKDRLDHVALGCFEAETPKMLDHRFAQLRVKIMPLLPDPERVPTVKAIPSDCLKHIRQVFREMRKVWSRSGHS